MYTRIRLRFARAATEDSILGFIGQHYITKADCRTRREEKWQIERPGKAVLLDDQ